MITVNWQWVGTVIGAFWLGFALGPVYTAVKWNAAEECISIPAAAVKMLKAKVTGKYE